MLGLLALPWAANGDSSASAEAVVLAKGATEPGSQAAQIYETTCATCHAEGVQGAPRPGEKADWDGRLAPGFEEIYLNVAEGMGPSMPPRGTCDDCSDELLRAVIQYMLAGAR